MNSTLQLHCMGEKVLVNSILNAKLSIKVLGMHV